MHFLYLMSVCFSYFLTDYDHCDNVALYNTFPSLKAVKISSYHKEQAWKKWTEHG